MARGNPAIWRRKGRKNWYAWIAGKQTNLGTGDYNDALAYWHRLCGHKPAVNEKDDPFVVELLNAFLGDLEAAGRTDYKWYLSRIKSFAAWLPEDVARLSELKPRHLLKWVADKKYSPTHASGSISAVQRAINWHVEQGDTGLEPSNISQQKMGLAVPSGANSGAVFVADTDLVAIIETWPALPGFIKAGVMAMIRAANDKLP